MQTEWNYSDRAHTYDARADYSEQAVTELLSKTLVEESQPVADIGAGTGKLTKLLLKAGLQVFAVEPNDNMRGYGISNTEGGNVIWSEGVGEATGLSSSSVTNVFFGSSFNVVDQQKTLLEAKRILKPGGWFACMWNHRDTQDPVQLEIEKIIHSFIPDYNYGNRRQDPTSVIEQSGLFQDVHSIDQRFIVSMQRDDIISAWRSHDTLFRQAGEKFDDIIEAISCLLTDDEYPVPYNTRIWYCQLKSA